MRWLFAHGAGLSSRSPWMTAWAARLAALGPVHTFDYPYMAAGRRRPDPLPVLIDAHEAELDGLEGPVWLVGKSMGSRVGCHVAARAPERVAGVVCFGYPLIGQGPRAPLRDAVLRELTVPTLFIQGTRDAMCPLDALEAARAAMRAPSTVHVVPTGDHSLQVTRAWSTANGQDQGAVDDAILGAVRAFVMGERAS
jgi:predicted alpha/beta-hydrolase family hydrolase